MMRSVLLALALTLACAPGAGAQEQVREDVVAGLSQNRVSITANFDGSEILIFGAVKRDAPPPDTGPLQVIITVTGPSNPEIVRRKTHVYGIWANTDSVEVDSAPSFYAVATTGPLGEILSDIEDLRHRISINRMIRSVGAPMYIMDAQAFAEALVRIRERDGSYRINEGSVILSEETLFRTSVALPANLIEGGYTVRMFLTRERRIVGAYETEIQVSKVGLERWMFDLAHERPLVYGLLSLFIAVVSGWGASAIFQRLRL